VESILKSAVAVNAKKKTQEEKKKYTKSQKLKAVEDLESNALKAIEKFTKEYEQLLSSIFDTFDTDKNSILDPKESERLVAAAIEAMQKAVPELIAQLSANLSRKHMATAYQIDHAEIREIDASKVTNDEAVAMGQYGKRVESNAKAIYNIAKAQSEKKLKMLLDDKKAVAAAIFKSCDTNGDGKLTRNEFQTGFIRAACEVVRLDKGQAVSESCMMM